MTKHDDADTLHAVPPRDFVRARNALADELAKNGKPAEARRIRRLPRPSPVVWALNKAARGAGTVSELADAVDQLRRAQLGQGDLRPATERYRAALESLVRAVIERLRETDIRVSPAIERRLQSTLLAAVTDRGLRADLAAGRLAEEHAAPGFEVLTQGPIPATFLRARPANAKAGRARTQPRAPAPRAEEPRAEHRRAETERQARKATRQAERRVKALDEAARRTQRAAEAADRKVAAMRTALHEQERQAALLRSAARAARETLARARRSVR